MFIVDHGLTVDCLLGAAFLKKHGAVLDCKSGTLPLGLHVVPLHNILQNADVSLQTISRSEIVSVLVKSTQEIPGRPDPIQLITCKVKGIISCFADSMEDLAVCKITYQICGDILSRHCEN